MAEVVLAESTGNTQMDTVVREVIARFLMALPDRLRAVYVLGSYADASAAPTSDLDLELILAGSLREGEHERIQPLLAAWASQADSELDIEVKEEAGLSAGVSPTLKLGSRLLWGADVRQRLPLIPLTIWTRGRMHTSYWRLAGLFSRPAPLTMPLDYPDPHDEFYGYARRLTHLPGGELAPGTRDLMRAVGWMATTLLAFQAGQYVATKRACATMYREHIGGEWATLLDDMAEWVRGVWQYRIPAAQEERAQLRAICARTLGFENHFLALYRHYALSELHGDDSLGSQLAIVAQQRIPLADADVMTAMTDAEQR